MKYLSTTLSKTVFATLLFAMAISLATAPASAAIVFNGSGAASNTFQQTTNNPCVIGDPSCKQPAGFGETTNTGPGDYDLFSPVYIATSPFSNFTGGLIPLAFTVGIDSNIATGAGLQTLNFFKTYACDSNGLNCVLDAANSFQTATQLPNNNNGNGFSDATLNGFSLINGTKYKFEASLSNATDGMEEYFIIPTGSTNPPPPPPSVPEPITMSLVGSGLIGLACIRRLRRQR